MANMYHDPFMVAVAQATPVFLDREATLEKACELIVDAGLAGARLIVFPLAFIPGYPAWVWTMPANQASKFNELYTRWFANAVSIPSDTTDRLCRIAQRARINVVMGINELSSGTCYNTLLYIDAQGQIVGKHRSIAATGAERLVWSRGDGSTLQVYTLPFATISGLIGGEHYLPLARYALYAWGTQISIATSWDQGEVWLATLRHIAREGRSFVLNCGMALHTNDIFNTCPPELPEPARQGQWLHAGESAIVDPNGTFIAGPVRERETTLYAQIDPRQLCESKWMLDATNYDARPDIFQLTINRQPHPVISNPLKQG